MHRILRLIACEFRQFAWQSSDPTLIEGWLLSAWLATFLTEQRRKLQRIHTDGHSSQLSRNSLLKLTRLPLLGNLVQQ